jgi:adenylylsulfate kinase
LKILICGLPGSGKSTIAEPLAKLIGGVWINADAVRSKYEGPDVALWDFSLAGRVKQAQRMKHLADGVVLAGKIAITDFICPTTITRKAFGADYTVWMNTIKEGRFEDTNKMFTNPDKYDYCVSEWFTEVDTQLANIASHWQLTQIGKGRINNNER